MIVPWIHIFHPPWASAIYLKPNMGVFPFWSSSPYFITLPLLRGWLVPFQQPPVTVLFSIFLPWAVYLTRSAGPSLCLGSLRSNTSRVIHFALVFTELLKKISSALWFNIKFLILYLKDNTQRKSFLLSQLCVWEAFDPITAISICIEFVAI